MANEKTPVVWDDTTKKHRPLGSGEKMGGLSASSMISSDSGNLLQQGSDGLMLVTGGSIADPRADNLLEESDNGKLQVTTERVVEWLDGHPQAAAAIADAVKVVSEDSGNVIVQGSDKGAYLAKGAISAAVSAMTDAQKNQLADAISPRIAADIADGQTIVASNGKLTFNPANATAAQKKAINQALADADSGLVVNNSTGKLGVDFSNMPTDKFEELLESLNMLVPLESNLALYVSVNDANALEPSVVGGKTVYPDGIGTQAKPFKKIQDCVNYVTGKYSLGTHRVWIRIVAGVYREAVTLPEFSAGTGYILLVSNSGARDVEIAPPLSDRGGRLTAVSVTGGSWQLENIKLSRVENPTTDVNYVGCLLNAGSGSSVRLYGMAFDQSFPSSPVPLGGETYGLRLIWVDSNASLTFGHGNVSHSISTTTRSGEMNIDVLFASRGGKIVLAASTSDSVSHDVVCSGSCTTFASGWQNGQFNVAGSGTRLSFTGSVEGQRYSASKGSYIFTGTGAADYFPGSSGESGAGYVEASTYCWYA